MRGGHLGGAATLGDPQVFSTMSSSMIRDLGCFAGGGEGSRGALPCSAAARLIPTAPQSSLRKSSLDPEVPAGAAGTGTGKADPIPDFLPIVFQELHRRKEKNIPG